MQRNQVLHLISQWHSVQHVAEFFLEHNLKEKKLLLKEHEKYKLNIYTILYPLPVLSGIPPSARAIVSVLA